MLFPPFVRLGLSLLLLAGLLWTNAAAQTPPAKSQDPPDFDRLAKIFSPPGTPSIQGKRWVVIEAGLADWPTELEGWIIRENAKELRLLDWYGELHTLRKPTPQDKRQELKEDKDGGIDLTDLFEADISIAWKIRAEDYIAKSKKFLADGLPKNKDDGVFRIGNEKFRLAGHIVDAARHAHFAHLLGQKEHANELYTYAFRWYATYADNHFGGVADAVTLPVFVADQIAFNHRYQALHSAHDGTPRKKLLTQWEKIAAIPYHQYRDEADKMGKHYRELLEEDAKWVEPDAKALKNLTTEQQVAYWLYHLRDLDIGQSSNPGHCNIFDEYNRGHRDGIEGRPNAAKELKKLGRAAVPQLIAHLDDERPTRCKGHWRWYWPEGHYLLRYGDCCQQIFESITGHALDDPGDYPIQDGEGKRVKAMAEKWWRTNQKKTP